MAFNSLNNITVVGRITADPELKQVGSGVSVCSFTLAVDRSYAKKGEERETDFIPCTVWRGNADFVAKFAHKGDVVGVTGELHSRKYDDKDGNKRTAYDVIANEISIFNGKKGESGGGSSYSEQTPENIDVASDDDLPF